MSCLRNCACLSQFFHRSIYCHTPEHKSLQLGAEHTNPVWLLGQLSVLSILKTINTKTRKTFFKQVQRILFAHKFLSHFSEEHAEIYLLNNFKTKDLDFSFWNEKLNSTIINNLKTLRVGLSCSSKLICTSLFGLRPADREWLTSTLLRTLFSSKQSAS